MGTIQFLGTTPEALAEQIAKSVTTEISKQLKSINTEQHLSEYLSPDEAAKLLGVTKSTIWRYKKRGKLTAYNFENKVYYKQSEIINGFSRMV
jgi:excisionase family DNA binding protein